MSEFQKLDFSLVWYSFLALMQEKNQKKIKPPAGGGEVWSGTCLGDVCFCALYIPIH